MLQARTKYPEDERTFTLDLTASLAGKTITTLDQVETDDDLTVIASGVNSGNQKMSIKIGGGVAGQSYTVLLHYTRSDGDKRSAGFLLGIL